MAAVLNIDVRSNYGSYMKLTYRIESSGEREYPVLFCGNRRWFRTDIIAFCDRSFLLAMTMRYTMELVIIEGFRSGRSKFEVISEYNIIMGHSICIV